MAETERCTYHVCRTCDYVATDQEYRGEPPVAPCPDCGWELAEVTEVWLETGHEADEFAHPFRIEVASSLHDDYDEFWAVTAMQLIHEMRIRDEFCEPATFAAGGVPTLTWSPVDPGSEIAKELGRSSARDEARAREWQRRHPGSDEDEEWEG
jgi:hypothetical protein